MEKKLISRVLSNPSPITFLKVDGEELFVKSINYDNNGNLESITDIFENTYSKNEVIFVHDLLEIPGFGYITPETRVVFNDKDYVLKYGWHTNISNQTIFSWYLISLEEDTPPKTLYKEDINKINFVHFR